MEKGRVERTESQMRRNILCMRERERERHDGRRECARGERMQPALLIRS